MKRFLPLFLLLCLLLSVPARADELSLDAPSALLMEKRTGTVLYAKDEHTPREPASVTKVMTLLLTMEAIDSGALSYDDTVSGSAHAASMGGSQIWLKEGEKMRVEELIKAVCVVSGNDAAVALGEHLAGSEEAFVARMNERAKELGMNDTHFVNCTGLPAEGHLTSACDIALMSRELILKHPDIRRFTTIWMDSLRGGQSMLVNTNKLVRFYDGATGLKTGSTSTARYCISATAERDGMELIAVVLGGSTSDKRFTDAKTLLNYGFMDAGFYTAAQITPNVKYYHQTNVPLQEMLDEQVRYIHDGVCDYVVTRGRQPEDILKTYDLIAAAETPEGFWYDEVYLYRRKGLIGKEKDRS